MAICKKDSSMSSLNELRSLVYMRFNAVAPLSGQALVTGANFIRFGNIALNEEMPNNLVSNHSVGVFPGCVVVVIGDVVFRSCATNLKCSHSDLRASTFTYSVTPK